MHALSCAWPDKLVSVANGEQMLATAGGAVFSPFTLQTRLDVSQSQHCTQLGGPGCTEFQSASQTGAGEGRASAARRPPGAGRTRRAASGLPAS